MDQWITSFSDSSIHTVRPGKDTAAGQTGKREDKKVEKKPESSQPGVNRQRPGDNEIEAMSC